MSAEMTTPKRNEAVDVWFLRPDPSTGGVRMAKDKPEGPSLEYVLHSDYAALQGEVSRLRADAMRYRYLRDLAHPDSDEGFAVMRDEMNEWGKWYAVHVTGDALDAAIDALNLEPPTDGR